MVKFTFRVGEFYFAMCQMRIGDATILTCTHTYLNQNYHDYHAFISNK